MNKVVKDLKKMKKKFEKYLGTKVNILGLREYEKSLQKNKNRRKKGNIPKNKGRINRSKTSFQ